LGVRPYVQEASAVIVLIGDPDVSNAWEADLAAAGENIALAATAMGLGLAWVGDPASVAWDVTEKKIKELLGIPARMGILCLQAVGYAAKEVEPHTKEERWDDSRVHYNKFSNLKGEWAPKKK
jgi:nitroreductase